MQTEPTTVRRIDAVVPVGFGQVDVFLECGHTLRGVEQTDRSGTFRLLYRVGGYAHCPACFRPFSLVDEAKGGDRG